MKNQIFDFSRCMAYMNKYLTENRNQLLVKAGILLLVPILFCLGWPYFISGCYNPALQYPTLMTGIDPMWASETSIYSVLWIFVCCITTYFFLELAKKNERVSLLTCPASNLEKFIVNFLIYVVAFQVLFVVFFIFADALRVWVMRGIFGNPQVITIDYIPLKYLLTFGGYDIFPGADMENMSQLAVVNFCSSVFMGLLLQSVFGLGATIWPKNSGMKTACFLFVYLIIAGILFTSGVSLFHSAYNAQSSWINGAGKGWIFNGFLLCVTVFFWVLTYFRFKEWEVIKRW